MMVDASWHGKKPMSPASATPPPSGAHAYVYARLAPSSPPPPW